jgi:hypothetical protein
MDKRGRSAWERALAHLPRYLPYLPYLPRALQSTGKGLHFKLLARLHSKILVTSSATAGIHLSNLAEALSSTGSPFKTPAHMTGNLS